MPPSQVAGGNCSYLPVYGNDYNTHDGTGVRDYIHITDLRSGSSFGALLYRAHKSVSSALTSGPARVFGL